MLISSILAQAWSTDPTQRPSIRQFTSRYYSVVGPKKGSLAERIFGKMQNYLKDLEVAVHDRSEQLMVERNNCDAILLQRLPK